MKSLHIGETNLKPTLDRLSKVERDYAEQFNNVLVDSGIYRIRWELETLRKGYKNFAAIWVLSIEVEL